MENREALFTFNIDVHIDSSCGVKVKWFISTGHAPIDCALQKSNTTLGIIPPAHPTVDSPHTHLQAS
jgi:hypothetical protein